MKPLFEIVPNISEGKDPLTLQAAVRAMEGAGARVAHYASDAAHHRSVITAFGEADAVVEAAVALAELTTQRIDLRTHHGEHPRIGALDVLPFVPIARATLNDAVVLAHRAAARIWQRTRVPSFYYEAAAAEGRPKLLAEVRAGGFEGLAARAARGEKPDVGDVIAHPSAGAIAIGARALLIAFNVLLDSTELTFGRRIARRLREKDGGLRTLRVLGVTLENGHVQISCNITDVVAVPLHRIVGLITHIAAREGIRVRGCELIGLIPRSALTMLIAHTLNAEVPTPTPA
jgi:glutamate formiminotransferase